VVVTLEHVFSFEKSYSEWKQGDKGTCKYHYDDSKHNSGVLVLHDDLHSQDDSFNSDLLFVVDQSFSRQDFKVGLLGEVLAKGLKMLSLL
jgi:hypothetical protein